MDDVREFFHETQEAFTIYIVEQRFVVGRGYSYFKSFIGKENLIASDSAIKKRIRRIWSWTQDRIPSAAELIQLCFFPESGLSAVTIVEIVTALSKLFAVEKHQAVGPEIIDPLIIQVGKISQRYLSELIALHQESILQPAIIILLKDNDFERAKQLVSKCPSGINVKMIRNSGECEIYKVINSGASETEEFLDLYSKQCFSTCSLTKRDILLSKEWMNNSLVHDTAPQLLRYRSLLVEDNKSAELLSDIDSTIKNLYAFSASSEGNEKVKEAMLCMLKLFRVYCLDKCTNDMGEAYKLSEHVGNEILQAHVLRYSNFFPQLSLKTKQEMLEKAYNIFDRNNIQDHAIYCKNNFLINQFYQDHIDLSSFQRMQEAAVYNVPGMVGMSYILNNTGVAYIYMSRFDDAIEYLEKGLPYAKQRPIQRLGIMTNILIAKDCGFFELHQEDVLRVITSAFDQFGVTKFPFLTANFITNAILAAAHIDYVWAHSLIQRFPIVTLLNTALSSKQFGTGSLSLQLALIQNQFPSLFDKSFSFPQKQTSLSGMRKRFIENHMFNPTIFNAWL